MSVPKVFESECRICLILWENEPMKSTVLVKLCEEKLGWSKAATYTVIKSLSEQGIVKSEDAAVTLQVSKDQEQEAGTFEQIKNSRTHRYGRIF